MYIHWRTVLLFYVNVYTLTNCPSVLCESRYTDVLFCSVVLCNAVVNLFLQPTAAPTSAQVHIVPPSTATTTTTTTTMPGSGALQLAPTSFSEVRPKSASRSLSRASRISRHSLRKTPESVRTAPPADTMVYPETFECDYLAMPKQKTKVLPRRDLPWVFRYKVKRNMNELSKIMASKSPPLVDAWILQSYI